MWCVLGDWIDKVDKGDEAEVRLLGKQTVQDRFGGGTGATCVELFATCGGLR